MNLILKDYEIPSTVTFFDSKIERGLGFIYGFKIQDDKASIIKIPAGTYNGVFESFF